MEIKENGKNYEEANNRQNEFLNFYSFNPASLFFVSSTSEIPGSASFQRARNFS